MHHNDPMPPLVVVAGRHWWQREDGKLLPYVAGGADDGPPPDTGTKDPKGTDPPDTGKDTKTDPPDTGGDQTAEVEKWKALSRKHEDQAKANSAAVRELEQFKRNGMSETEKAVDAAKAEGRAAALREVGGRLVEAEFKSSAAGRLGGDQLTALIDGLDRQRFLDADGEVDTAKVQALIDSIAPAPVEDKGKAGRTIRAAQGQRNGKAGPSVQAGADMFAARRRPPTPTS